MALAHKRTTLVVVVAVALFGPYLVSGLRTEQLALYAYAGVLVLATGFGVASRLNPTTAAVLATWGLLAVIAISGAIFHSPSSLPAGDLLGGLDNVLLPLACLVVGADWARGGPELRRSRLDAFAAVCVYALALNAVFALFATRTGTDISGIGRHFWTLGEGTASVAEAAAKSGRLGGIFNQPAEAGIAYSLGIQMALWRWSWREQRPRRLAVMLVLLVVGGLLSVSKVFIFAGMTLLFLQMFFHHHGRRRRVIVLVGGTALALGALMSGIVHWEGREQLVASVTNSADGSLLHQISAGRVGEKSFLQPIIKTVMSEQPVVGYGAQGAKVAYDSTFLEMLVTAGLLGVALHTLVFVIIISAWWRLRNRQLIAEQRLTIGVLVITLAGSLGLPVTTANRVGPMIWLLLGLLVIHVPIPQRYAVTRSRSDHDDSAFSLSAAGVAGPST